MPITLSCIMSREKITRDMDNGSIKNELDVSRLSNRTSPYGSF